VLEELTFPRAGLFEEVTFWSTVVAVVRRDDREGSAAVINADGIIGPVVEDELIGMLEIFCCDELL